jgi:hypothetical protein
VNFGGDVGQAKAHLRRADQNRQPRRRFLRTNQNCVAAEVGIQPMFLRELDLRLP